LLGRLVEKYRRSIALVNPRPAKYTGATRELKIALLSTLAIVALYGLAVLTGLLDSSDPLITVLLVLALLAP